MKRTWPAARRATRRLSPPALRLGVGGIRRTLGRGAPSDGSPLPFKAVMASDFAVPRFRYLERLLIVHGHWCYSRLANMVLYFFYKNTVGVGHRRCLSICVPRPDLRLRGPFRKRGQQAGSQPPRGPPWVPSSLNFTSEPPPGLAGLLGSDVCLSGTQGRQHLGGRGLWK